MGKVHIIQSNFSGGEIDPKLRGNVGIPRYQNGLETLLNAYPLITGGATRRGGLRFVDNEGTGKTLKLVPFTIFKKDVTPAVLQGYVVELRSDNLIFFYTNVAIIKSGGVPYSIASPFIDADLTKVRYAQFNNVLYLVHPDFAPQRLVRTSDVNWGITAVAFTQPATPHWDASTGYPSALTFFEQRMILAATKTDPQTIWGSQSGVITNLVTGTGDSDPFKFTPSAATSNIVHLAAIKHILVETYDKELSIQGGIEKPLTPTNVQIKELAGYGCHEKVKPLVVGGELLFVTRHGKKLRALSYAIEDDRFRAPDVSIVSGHLTEGGIEQMAYTVEPIPMIWAVTTDGDLLTATFDRDQDVIAWAKHATDGAFKDVVVIPYNGTDQVWVAVERTVNYVTNTYVEVLDPSLNTDSAVAGEDSSGKATWTGLTHLEGKTVDIVADGAVMPSQVVTGGQITLPRNASAVEVGLHYESIIKDLPPGIPTAIGTAQGQAVSVNKVIVRLHNSAGCEINGEVVPFKQYGEDFFAKYMKNFLADGGYYADGSISAVGGEKPYLFTGDKSINTLGWDKKGVVTIKQTQPLPFTVLAIIKEVTING